MPTLYSRQCDLADCRRPFQTWHKKTVFCSGSCAAKTRQERRGFPAWRDAEICLLEKLSGKTPFPDIVCNLQALAQQHGWKPRTESAVISYMSLKGYTRRCDLDNFKTAELARILGLSATTVDNWKRSCGLPYRKISRTQTAISLKDFKKWAISHPQYVARLDRENLLWVLQDAKLVDRICQSQSSTKGIPIRVRRIDTGEEYPSLAAAAKHGHIHQTTLSYALRHGRTVVCGIPWEVLS